MSSFSNSAGAVGGVMAAGLALGTVAVVAAGVASVKMAGDYEQSMKKVQALTGTSKAQMSDYDASLKQLAVNAGVAPKALADGLYNVISAGYKGKDAMTVLTLATEDAKIGMTSATVTTDALTNVMKNFNAPAKDAVRVNGEMLETVTLGKATFEQYANNITKAASTSKQFGESMETMNAAWSTLTSNGIKAGQATTDYNQSLKVMDGNIGTVAKSLNKNGIAFNETAFNAMDYGHKTEYLNTALQKANAEHVKITGVTVQASQAISTIANHIKDYNSNLDTLSNKQEMAKKTQDAWNITQGGFNQSMDRVKASIDVLMISVGNALLPSLTKLANAIVPLIGQFTNWLLSGNRLQNFMDGLVKVVTNVATWIGNFAKELQTNRPMLDAFIVVIGALAGIIGGLMVAALVAMAIAAWAAIAPLLPFILIGAAIGAVIALVIVIFMHWGEIAHWLQGIWGAFVGWLQGIWGGLGAWFQGILGSIEAFWKQKWKQITDAVGEAIAIIQTVIRVGFSILIDIVFGPIIAIVGFFQWLYNHNYYFKDLVDKIKEIFTGAFTWLKDQWNRFTGWLGGIWDGIKGKASDAWGSITDTVKGKTTDAGNALHTGWTNTSTTLSTQWNNFSKFMEKAWQLVMDVLNIIWTKFIGPPLTKLWNQFSTWFGNLAGQAVTWGQNLIQGFINGIQGMFGNVTSTVQNLMGNVASFLGFHSPAEKGPGKELDIWGPNLVKGFAAGVDKSSPILAASLTHLIQYPGGLSGASAGGSASSGAGGGQTIIIELDSKQLSRTVLTQMDKQVRLKVGNRSTRVA